MALGKIGSGSGYDGSAPSAVGVDTPDYAYPHGHLGHLMPAQDAAFARFKRAVVDGGLHGPGEPVHGDVDLL